MEIKTSIEILTNDSVSIRTQKYIIYDGELHYVGQPHNVAYINNISGREDVNKLGEPYRSAIFAMWGNEPTIETIDITKLGGINNEGN